MTTAETEGRSHTEWQRIFDRIQEALARALERTPEPPPTLTAGSAARAPVEVFARGLAELQACLERAAQCAADADAPLHAEADGVRRWMETAKQVREKLANGAGEAAATTLG